MRNCIKTLLLSTIVLVIGNNNCYSTNDNFFENFLKDFFKDFDDNFVRETNFFLKTDFYDDFNYFLHLITMDNVPISYLHIEEMISEIESTAQQAFQGNQFESRNYAKLLCYLKLMSECQKYLGYGDYAMLRVAKKACNEFLDKKNTYDVKDAFAIQDIQDNKKLHDLYDTIENLSKYAQMEIDKIQKENPSITTDKYIKFLEDNIDERVEETMKVWDYGIVLRQIKRFNP